jgi:hypothetical protein
MAPAQVVLADGSLDRERVLRHVGAEGTVGPVDVVVRAVVDDDCQLRGRISTPSTRPTGRICPVQGIKTVAWPRSLVKRSAA